MKTRYHKTFISVCFSAVVLLAANSHSRADHPSIAFGGGGSGPINAVSASTLPEGKWASSLRMEYLDFDRYTDAQLERFGLKGIHADSVDYSLGAFASLGYGLTDNITVGMRLPYFYTDDIREPEEELGIVEVANEGDAAGLGDFLFMSVLRLHDDEASKLTISAIAGLEIPTGHYTARNDEGDLFELEHQPSSHSWDPLVGLALRKGFDHWSFHSSATYMFVTEGAYDTNLGDVCNYNAAVVFHLFGDSHDHSHSDDFPTIGPSGVRQASYVDDDADHDHGDHDHGDHDHSSHDHGESSGGPDDNQSHEHNDTHRGASLDGILELNGIWEGKDVIGSERDNDSGGNVIYLAPGLRLTLNERMSCFASTGFPVIQNLNGANHRVEFRLVLGTAISY